MELFVEIEHFAKNKEKHYRYKPSITDEQILLLHPNYLKLRETSFVMYQWYRDDFTTVIYKYE